MDHANPVEVLQRWVEHGARYRVMELSDDHVVLELRTCYGEPVDRLESRDAGLLRYVREHDADPYNRRVADKSPSDLIDERIKELDDWRGEMLSRVRALVKEADPEVAEEWKWRGVPVWSHDGIICTGETYKNVVKMTFVKGASLEDPAGLFNSSLEGNTRRAIDFHEGEEIDEKALKVLIRAAVELNTSSATQRPKSRA